MANVKKDHHVDPEVAIETAIGKTENFLEKNTKVLTGLLIAVIVIVGGYFGYKYLYAIPQANKAADMMYVAEQQFLAQEYQLALDGDGGNAGFLEIVDRFGSTPQGNMARHYAGVCYMKLGNAEEAMAMLEKYKPTEGVPNGMINALNYGMRADLLVEKDDYKGALELYRKAIEAGVNPLTTPYFLKKAGLVCEHLGDKAAALECYNRIRNEFGSSLEARDVEKSIGRAEQL